MLGQCFGHTRAIILVVSAISLLLDTLMATFFIADSLMQTRAVHIHVELLGPYLGHVLPFSNISLRLDA